MMHVDTTIHLSDTTLDNLAQATLADFFNSQAWCWQPGDSFRYADKTTLDMLGEARDLNQRWVRAACAVSASIAGTPVHTPEAFMQNQSAALTRFLDYREDIRKAQFDLRFVDANGSFRWIGVWYELPFERNGIELVPVNSVLAKFLWRRDISGVVQRWDCKADDFRPVVWCLSLVRPQ